MPKGFRSRICDPKEFIVVSAIAPEREPNRSVEMRGRKLRFPRTLRLLRHADFERVYKLGRRHFSASMTVFYLQREQLNRPAGSGLRIGFTVGRALGGAVVRNRIKRRLREAVRLSPRPALAPDVDVVINPKKSLLTADFAALMNEVARAFVVIEGKFSGSRKPEPQSSRSDA
jgi:ribonuclease P protein component